MSEKLSYLRHCILQGCIFAVLLLAVSSSSAAIVWSGPLLAYNQPSSDPTQPVNQDRITSDVWLTRAASKGLFNAFYETSATTLSPTNTEWAFGTLTNYASLQYANWLALLNGQSPTTLVGQHMVVHLISDDIYISIQFTLWIPGGSGGFAYQRSTPTPPMLSGAMAASGQFFFNYAADVGGSYVIQGSTNLVDWVAQATNVAATSPMVFSNSLILTGPVFYRVKRLNSP